MNKKELYGLLISLIIGVFVFMFACTAIYDSSIFLDLMYVLLGILGGALIFVIMAAIGLSRMTIMAPETKISYWVFLSWPIWFLPVPIFMIRSLVSVVHYSGAGILIMLVLSWLFNIMSHALYVKCGEHPWRR